MKYTTKKYLIAKFTTEFCDKCEYWAYYLPEKVSDEAGLPFSDMPWKLIFISNGEEKKDFGYADFETIADLFECLYGDFSFNYHERDEWWEPGNFAWFAEYDDSNDSVVPECPGESLVSEPLELELDE